MPYTPENNPYIPGDPYSYDLKWQVDHIKYLQGRVDDLDASIQEATDQADRAEDEADRATQQADRATDRANDSNTDALKSEGFAVGEQNGTAVGSDSPYYQNNSKYYSEQAFDSEQAAADYAAHIADPVSGLVTSWLADHITQPTTPAIDTSLMVSGAAADALVTGDMIRDLDRRVGNLIEFNITQTGFTYVAFKVVAGQTYLFDRGSIVGTIYVHSTNTSHIAVEQLVAISSGVQTATFTPTYDEEEIRFQVSYTGDCSILIREGLYSDLYDTNGNLSSLEKVAFTQEHEYVTSTNYSAKLPDLDAAIDTKFYMMRLYAGGHPANLPSDLVYSDGDVYYIDVKRFWHANGTSTGKQIIFDAYMKPVWLRAYNADALGNPTWGSWTTEYENLEYIVGSSGDFTSIYDACKAAYAHINVTVRVKPGTYDLISEIGADLDSSFPGIYIGNGMKLIFEPGAYVTCNYTGGDATIAEIFSAFMIGHGDVLVDGLNITASNIRYCIHDDVGGESATVKHIYKNCNMSIDNSSSPSATPFTQCIGGGLGRYTDILVENCVFNSVCQTTDPVVSWHNTNHYNDAVSYVVIRDNYCEHGTVRAGYFGASTLMTQFLVTNNSVESAPYKIPENIYALTDNIDFRSWNNEVR